MSDAPEAAAFVVHSITHLRAALAAGAACRRPIIALSAPAASGYAGAAWFAAMVDAAKAEFPDVPFTPVIDCGDRAGDALAALELGLRHLIFTGHPDAAARLAAIAAEAGAVLLDRRPAALDLLDLRDPRHAAQKWCERLPASNRSVIESQPKQSPD
jgi:hypothetical protein